ncbi:flagellar assembly protein FliW [Clostridium akagii]|uniref:flagellar assembly protein FliW n=1 Tax=Clostridium akagii TaxID=91623 RepID=UPI00047DA4E4|nr:flagellar assembly protein FliW [Clostridium akagii]
MKLYSKYHGIKEYTEEDIITFEKGIPGFKDLKTFILFPFEENNVFSMLHSIENSEIGLFVVSPFYVMKDYEINLDDNTKQTLKIESEADVLIFSTVCVNNDLNKITTNLKAPIVINIKEHLGEQLILDDEKYLIKQPLLREE